MPQITGFSSIDVQELNGEISIQQHGGGDPDVLNVIYFPPDRADAVIAAIKAVKREMAAKPETPAA